MNFKYLLSFTLFAALITYSCSTKKEIPITPETALQRYLDNGDKTFSWKIIETYKDKGSSVTAYDLALTSQQWREHIWKHQLTVLVPDELIHDGALLFITGGSVQDGEPRFKDHEDELTANMGIIAQKNSSIVAIVRQTPNQPLYDDLGEDELISFTLHNFKNDGDYTWPLLFPMVKSAVKAMDAIQEFSKKELKHKINRFIVSGKSKRGWTTWLTGANDPRVTAIAPMVIDVLNMPVSLDYQMEAWQEYSIQLADYTNLEIIPQSVHTEVGDALRQMVDPYSYRINLNMPKMIFIGTIDEYWPVDAIKNYIDSIPGQNFIQYIPNAGHDLGDGKQVYQALSSFLATTLLNQDYPRCEWEIEESGSKIYLSANANPDKLLNAIVWSAVSEDRDFRDEEWNYESLGVNMIADINTQIDYPDTGYKAFYMDLKYTDPNGEEYVKSTRMFVADTKQVL